MGERLLERRERGYKWLKMDVGVDLLWDVPGALISPPGARDDKATMHPFTGIQVTTGGIEYLVDYVSTVRGTVGYDVPLAVDHLGHIGLSSCLRLGQAFEPFTLAWLEDLVPWQLTDQWRQLTARISTPTCTGEDIYLKENFRPLLERAAVRVIHPDPATAGGIVETKKIGDLAEEHGVPMALHHGRVTNCDPGQRAYRGSHRKFPRAGAPRRRCGALGRARHRLKQPTGRGRLHLGPRRPGPGFRRHQRRAISSVPGPVRPEFLRGHIVLGRRSEPRPAVELTTSARRINQQAQQREAPIASLQKVAGNLGLALGVHPAGVDT